MKSSFPSAIATTSSGNTFLPSSCTPVPPSLPPHNVHSHTLMLPKRGTRRTRGINNEVGVEKRSFTTSTHTQGKRTSVYRGVTRHRWSRRYEAHLWDKTVWNAISNKKGRQGAYDDEEVAAHTFDLAALKYWGRETALNFPPNTYTREYEFMQSLSREESLATLRRQSSSFSRGVLKYRGVTRQQYNNRWEARIGRVSGQKTEEEAAVAYDLAAIEYRGASA
ncbi:hypothetical protein GIB67_031817, partial [Kingdonia uniflora]